MNRYILKDADSKTIVSNWLRDSMVSYAKRSRWAWADEDALCEAFLSAISGKVQTPAGRLGISGFKVRGRGKSAPERRLGADGIGIVQIETTSASLSGFFLYQSKKASRKNTALSGVRAQCEMMLSHTAASQAMVLMPKRVVLVGAMAIQAFQSGHPKLAHLPYNEFPRFVADQVLRGLMIAPLMEATVLRDLDLLPEIRYILSIVASDQNWIGVAEDKVMAVIAELGLEANQIRTH